jgi:hypothetical protein
MTLKTEYTIGRVVEAYQVLKDADDLSPRNQDITRVLTALVGSISESYSEQEEFDILNDARIKPIRKELLTYLSRAESEMEKFWADKFLAAEDLTLEDVKGFWYWQNYIDLVDAEMPHMAEEMKGIHKDRKVAFVGAGPLPLTAIIEHLKTNVQVTCVDNDPVACIQARGLIKKLGLSDKIDVKYASGADFDYAGHDAVMVASLVPHKDDVVTRIRETAGQEVLIGVRSAERLHALLYEPVSPDENALKQCRYVSKTVHDPRVINTTLFFQAKPLSDFERAALPKIGQASRVKPAKKESCGKCNKCNCVPKF